ncbi:MAG TPA: ABC transporter ATP-binding protein [Trueperaceae bacterium]
MTATASPGGTMLEVDGVVKRFGGLRAVDGCSFTVAAGSITGLIGPNGAGKSTLFNLVTGALSPDAGSIRFEGRRISGLPPERIAGRGIGRTFQTPRLFYDMTVWENLALAGTHQPGETLWGALVRPPAARRRERALQQQAAAMLDFLGLGRLAGEPAHNLSGGQRKLLALGRALMMEPRLILLDEPAAGVNQTLTRTLMERIADINRQGVTFLIVEHDMDLIMSLCDRVVVMHHGRVLTAGRPAEVQQNADVVEAYLGGQV